MWLSFAKPLYFPPTPLGHCRYLSFRIHFGVQINHILAGTKCKFCFMHQWFILKGEKFFYKSVKRPSRGGWGEGAVRGGLAKDNTYYWMFLCNLPLCCVFHERNCQLIHGQLYMYFNAFGHKAWAHEVKKITFCKRTAKTQCLHPCAWTLENLQEPPT